MAQQLVGSSALGRRPPDALYFDRELSWLTFNERVLAEACNDEYPLLERLRFLSISGSNLDEFLMIRAAGLAGQVRSGIERLSIDGRTPSQELVSISARVRDLENEYWRICASRWRRKGCSCSPASRLLRPRNGGSKPFS